MYETSALGFEILAESLVRTPIALGPSRFDWVISFNGTNPHIVEYLRNLAKLSSVPIRIVVQDAATCPLPLPQPLLGMWKTCPPRLNIDTHEIICDNDIVFVQQSNPIQEFIDGTRAMMAIDTVRFFGKLDHLHPSGEKWNSGLIGLPPGYDFGRELKRSWDSCGQPNHMGYGEEQSLITHVLKKQNPIIVGQDHVRELHPDTPHRFSDSDCAFHFVESNRKEHRRAREFLAWVGRNDPKIPML